MERSDGYALLLGTGAVRMACGPIDKNLHFEITPVKVFFVGVCVFYKVDVSRVCGTHLERFYAV